MRPPAGVGRLSPSGRGSNWARLAGQGLSRAIASMLSLAELLSFVNFPSTVAIMDVTDREFERSNLFLRTMSQVQGRTAIGRSVSLALLLSAFAMEADPPIPDLTVCEILADLPAHEGKDVAVLGRFSFRRDGRWIGEQSCEPATTVPPLLWLI